MNPPIVGQLRGDLVVSAPGTSAPLDAERITQMNSITPGWMAAYGTGIRAGRDFDDRDLSSLTPQGSSFRLRRFLFESRPLDQSDT